MKKKFAFIVISLLAAGLVVQCSAKKDDWTPAKPELRPNAHIIKKQVDMIRIGDTEVKATAFLGQPTVRKATQNGTELIWYLISSDFREDAYETLKNPPKETEGHKFIRLFIDNTGKISEREFEL